MTSIKIPQDLQVSDKLLGPFSLVQTIALAFGGGISFVMFTAIQKAFGSVPPAAHAVIWWPVIITLAFAMVKINGIPLFRYLLLSAEMMSKPRQRPWGPRKGIVINYANQEKEKKGKKKKGDGLQKDKSNVRLDELSSLLDTRGRNESGPAISIVKSVAPAKPIDTIIAQTLTEPEISDDDLLASSMLGEDELNVAEHRKRIDSLANEGPPKANTLDSSIDDIHLN